MPCFHRRSHSDPERRGRSQTDEGEAEGSEVETAKRYYLDPPVQLETTARAASLSHPPPIGGERKRTALKRPQPAARAKGKGSDWKQARTVTRCAM